MSDTDTSYFCDLARTHKRAIDGAVAAAIAAAPDPLALPIANLRFALDPAAAKVAAEDGRYVVRSDGETITVAHRGRLPLYIKGLKKRSQDLAREYLLPQIPFQPGDLAVDCGANIGELYFWLRAQGADYVGVEPSPADFECLKRNAVDGTVHNMGLWREPGSLKFYMCPETADSSFIETARFKDVIEVPTQRLDALIPERPIKLLKLEAEGAELEVVEGCEAALPRISYIAADLGYERGAKAESTFSPVANFLLRRGFELVDVNHRRVTALFRNPSAA